MTKTTRIELIALAAAGLIVVTALLLVSKEPVLVYKTEPVTRGAIDAQIVTTGTLAPVNMIDVGSQVSGKIIQIEADFNSLVKKGQVLAEVDPIPFEENVRQNEDALRMAQADLEKAVFDADVAQKQYDRNLDMYGKHLISDEDQEASAEACAAAKERLKVAQAALKQAQEALNASRIDLSYTFIRSPIDGIVITRLVNFGQTLAAQMQTPVLFKVADTLDRLRVECDVDEADVGRVKNAEDVQFQVETYPDEVFHGRVIQVREGADTDQNVVTYKTIVEVDNPKSSLKPGMTAMVRIHVGQADNVLRLPNQALRFKPEDYAASAAPAITDASRANRDHVWVLSAGNKPVLVPLKIGLSDNILSEIVQGDLREGQAVITGVSGRR